MEVATSQAQSYMDVLSRLMFRGYAQNFEAPVENLESLQSDLEYVAGLSKHERARFVELANTHHVLVRALPVLENAAAVAGNDHVTNWCGNALAAERGRIENAIRTLQRICEALELAGCKITVIKSLDHWPDLGSDLDLYTSGDEQTIAQAMKANFNATPAARSWGDRLANKWNFCVPGLPELVEIHVRYLGQTGEHCKMARRVVERRVAKIVQGRTFLVPAPEERIVISTLQRMYRHFYFRLCDMADVAALLQAQAIDYAELRKAAETGGIWRGVATFLFLVSQYVKSYGGKVELQDEVAASAYSTDIRVSLGGDFLRVPRLPAASLYGAQLLKAGLHRDLRAMCRLPLLPPLAVSALLAYRLTGSDKGVW